MTNHKPFQEVVYNRGVRVYLRQPDIADSDYMLEIENNNEFWEFSETNEAYTREEIEQYILLNNNNLHTENQLRMMICLNSNGLQIGIIDLFDYNAQSEMAAIGIIIDEKDQSMGYGSESVRLLVEYSKTKLNLKILYAECNIDNTPSIQLFKKCGFHQVINDTSNRNNTEDFVRLIKILD